MAETKYLLIISKTNTLELIHFHRAFLASLCKAVTIGEPTIESELLLLPANSSFLQRTLNFHTSKACLPTAGVHGFSLC